MDNSVKIIKPGHFEPQQHFYPKALNSQLHAMVGYFLNLNREQIIERYHHLHPNVDKDFLHTILTYRSKYFFWGGADLFYVTTGVGNRSMVVLETNSCPSGQKSMPPRTDADEYRGYRLLIENSFFPQLRKKKLPEGSLAVIYDKNIMEASGYAATLAELTGEEVYLIPHYNGQEQWISWQDGILLVSVAGQIKPIRAAIRYVTQKPWNRIPVETKTFIYNSILACLAGGRNKLLASKAYEMFNSEIRDHGLKINTPQTIRDVSKVEVPLWVQRFGGFAVIKIPYSNAGQGVFTITSDKELKDFMAQDYPYDQFIVQSLIGHSEWSSQSYKDKYFHIGTMPNKKGNIYVADLRMMIYSTPLGSEPCAIYARRTMQPLTSALANGSESWAMLGTNLSVKRSENEWDSDTSRLMLMDRKDFNTLGIGTDDLIEAYIQTVLSVMAIDKMAINLINSKGKFRHKLFSSLDRDRALIKELMSQTNL